MCSFLITNKDIEYLETLIKLNKKINYKLKFRGPNHTEVKIINKITFIHNLLYITGKKTIQPLVKDNIVCLFNGEIYNYKQFNNEYQSDGECLIDLYLKYGDKFTSKLHGEFCIVLFDFNKNYAIISSDIFATKPIFLSVCDKTKKLGISSYKYTLEELGFKDIYKLEANVILKLCLNNYRFNLIGNVHKFKLSQHKGKLNDFNEALINSIKLRTNNIQHKLFITLSSGYDSGTLACLLKQLNIDFYTYTSLKGENKDIINKRIDYINLKDKSYIYNISESEINLTKIDLYKKVDKFQSFIDKNKTKQYNILTDVASYGLAYLFNEARKNDCIIHLSGQGPDEIFADYGFNGTKFKSHSCFGGKFPDKLETIFPWYSFFKGTQECFINKEEYIGGCYGIENRYPFLDKNVVQEFLHLSPRIKNRFYKCPLYLIMKQNNFPFEKDSKLGFSI
jgi:asparagine synthetase B (glutamine-hydrolysing)